MQLHTVRWFLLAKHVTLQNGQLHQQNTVYITTRVHKSWCQVARAKVSTGTFVGRQYGTCLYHHYGTYNFEVAPTFVENLSTHIVLRVSSITDHSMAALSRGKLASTMTSHDTCSAQDSDKKYPLCIKCIS